MPRVLLLRRMADVGLAVALWGCCLASAPAVAGEVGRAFRGLAAPLQQVRHPRPPHPPGEPCVEDLASRIAWLDRRLKSDGSIVAKQPDVWGQNRLTRQRLEYEEEMRRQLGQFAIRSSAALRRSDQAFLGMALAVQSASGRRRPAAEVVDVPAPSVVNTIQGMIPSTNEGQGRADSVVIARTAPLAFPVAPDGFGFGTEPPALEPTRHLDQLSRYLNHLQQLRRVNEGDDSADAPGYSLNLVRIPVSIQPGTRTRRGHGAEITISAQPCLGDDLLPATFRNLVVNDVVDLVAAGLTWCVNDPQCVAWATTIVTAGAADAAPADRGAARQGVLAAARALRDKLPAVVPATAPAVNARRARLPLPFTQLADVAGIEQIAVLVRDTRAALGGHPANQPCIGYLDVRSHLAGELQAAWDFLAVEGRRHVWQELPGWNLAALVRGRQVAAVAAVRRRFFAALGSGAGGDVEPLLHLPVPAAASDSSAPCGEADHALPALCRTTTAVLAWAILVESALLNDRLVEDVGVACGARCQGRPAAGYAGPFFGPDPAPEARAAFNDYVRCRWPIRVFALDPVTDEQNVEDSFARRRELQIALAAAAATGRLNAQALARHTRRLETDMAVVALNRTAVGFAHGADTFGWRFYPRVQTPPTRGTLATLGETIRGGPTGAADLAQRELEPGMRECTAIIVMPSFVPWLTLDVSTTWFALGHPRGAAPDIRDTLALSRTVKGMHAAAAACAACGEQYRDGEIPRLLRRVEQLDRELPLQTMQAQIPHENTAGGFELFTAGVTDLAPELLGWYGGPGIDPTSATTLFLVGKGFSVHDTAVVAGGRPARFTPLSPEVLRVEVPAGVATIVPCPAPDGLGMRGPGGPLQLAAAAEPLPAPAPPSAPSLPQSLQATPAIGPLPVPACVACDQSASAPCGTGSSDCNRREWVTIHLATPYGVSSHLLVPVVRRPVARAGGLAFDPACTLALTFTVTKTTAARSESARVDEFFAGDCDALTIPAPESFVPPAKAMLRMLLRDQRTGAVAATLSFDDPSFDTRHARYTIAGADLRNFVGDTSRPATDKTLRGAIKPYLDALLQQGGLDADGDSVALSLTAELVAGQQVVPVGGGVTVTATRRGKTAVEPQPTPAPAGR